MERTIYIYEGKKREKERKREDKSDIFLFFTFLSFFSFFFFLIKDLKILRSIYVDCYWNPTENNHIWKTCFYARLLHVETILSTLLFYWKSSDSRGTKIFFSLSLCISLSLSHMIGSILISGKSRKNMHG